MDIVLELRWLMISVSYLLVALVAIVVSKICLSKLTPFSLDEELTVKDNPAMGLAVAAYYVSVVIIFLGAAVGPSGDELPSTREWLTVLAMDLG
ncbi:MAG: DUF350 domain-containing protein, partial [Saprospiraceae bacterium]|nr:DUF350 domain-containing protein [Saprospiraceae bacterium]